MGVFNRMKDIINSNLNAMLDNAEDPEKMIRYIVREIEETIIDLKSSCAEKISEKARIDKELNSMEEKALLWANRANKAVDAGKDDLAREALVEKKRCEGEVTYLKSELEHLDKLISETKGNITKMEAKYDDVVQRQRILIQRGIHARETLRTQNTMKRASGAEAMARFDEMESKIERMEAEAELSSVSNSSLENEFANLESDEDIEAELAALKNKKKPASKPTTSDATEVKEKSAK